VSEEIDKVRQNYEKHIFKSERAFALRRMKFDLEVQEVRKNEAAELESVIAESSAKYQEAIKALELESAEALRKWHNPNKNRVITLGEAEKMIEQAKQEVMAQVFNLFQSMYLGQ
jgi:hypothetical protein